MPPDVSLSLGQAHRPRDEEEDVDRPVAATLDRRGSVARVDFALYYEQHMARLIRHVMRQGASPHEAAEAAQAAFAEAFVTWETIDSPGAWLRKVAYRLYLRQPARRREQLTSELPELPGGTNPLGTVELKEEEARVYAALSALPPAQRRVMAWSLDGFAVAEIAAALGMTAEAVRQNLSRARSRLKATLGLADGGGQ